MIFLLKRKHKDPIKIYDFSRPQYPLAIRKFTALKLNNNRTRNDRIRCSSENKGNIQGIPQKVHLKQKGTLPLKKFSTRIR